MESKILHASEGFILLKSECRPKLKRPGRAFYRKWSSESVKFPEDEMQVTRLNRRGEYLSMRDPEWWIQWENSPWRNPYARWGTEHMTSMYEERFVRPEFVVSVNTSHPNIRRVLDEGFRKAEDMLNEKASFAVEFNFNPMILRWWKTQGVKRYDSMECLELTAAVGANFVVTNCSAVNHFFDCHAAWCACWPFYLLFAVPYKIWRHAFQGIRDIPVTMEGKAISANISFSNYSLADLHIGFVLSNQPSLNAEGVQLSTVPLTNGIPSHILNSPPLQGPLGNSRFKANQECIR